MAIQPARFIVMHENTAREQSEGYPAKLVAASEELLALYPRTMKDFMAALAVVVRNHLGTTKNEYDRFGQVITADSLVDTPLMGRTYFEAFEAAYNARHQEPLVQKTFFDGSIVHTWNPVYRVPKTGVELPLTIITNSPTQLHEFDRLCPQGLGLQGPAMLDDVQKPLKGVPRILHPNYVHSPGFFDATEDAYLCLLGSGSRNDREAAHDLLMPLIGHSIGLIARGGTSATLIARETLPVLGHLDEPAMMKKGTDYWAHVIVRTVEEAVADHKNWYDRTLDPREVMDWHLSHAEKNAVRKRREHEMDYIQLTGPYMEDQEADALRAQWKVRADTTADPEELDHLTRMRVILGLHKPEKRGGFDMEALAALLKQMRAPGQDKQ
ncbi:MAG: hypothetical protein EB060_03025 [Proteobacteria bacterium]|nr:hypothetical protein [Pseudomonadota bacterium]